MDTYAWRQNNIVWAEQISDHDRTTTNCKNYDRQMEYTKRKLEHQRDTAILLYSGNHYTAVLIEDTENNFEKRLRMTTPQQEDPPTQRERPAKLRRRKRKREDNNEASLASATCENQDWYIRSNPKTGKARVAETGIPVIWDQIPTTSTNRGGWRSRSGNAKERELAEDWLHVN